MVKSEHEVELRFSQPIRQVLLMLSVLVLTSLGTVVAAPRVMAVFTANLWLNGFILFVFFVGLISCFVQVVQLIKSVRWIEEFVNKTSVCQLTQSIEDIGNGVTTSSCLQLLLRAFECIWEPFESIGERLRALESLLEPLRAFESL